jgi:hypothetical protein
MLVPLVMKSVFSFCDGHFYPRVFFVGCRLVKPKDSGLTDKQNRGPEMKFQVVFTIKNGIHPFTEIVDAESIDHVKQAIERLTKEAGVTLKHIVSIVQL